ncbi:MAG: 23S rRNA (pseudouridine(1915)-N(3))-methyltransferase RlmH [Chlamydiales bacterium]
MYQVKIFTIGKTKERWLADALDEYTTRLQKMVAIEWIIAKDDAGLARFLEKEKSFICLDPQGKLLDSLAFSKQLFILLTEGGSRLSIVIGGADGIPVQVKSRAKKLLSLSPLTFTHQLTRLILLEQLYRATEIEKGSPYHK